MKIAKYTEYILTKLRILYDQKIFKDEDQRIKYLLDRNKKSKTLIVVMSACTRKGIKARYNYTRTLKDISANKLFILDDLGNDGRGIFYLGKDYKFDTAKSVNLLIDKIVKKLNIENVIFCGSSKGGYASLYFGLERDSTIIIGAPQYNLGNYLNCDANRHILEYICGDVDDVKIKELNNLIYKKIQQSNNKNIKIYLHYSKLDHTYENNIKDLIAAMREYNCKFEIEELDYKTHAEVSIYFPKYLKSTLRELGV